MKNRFKLPVIILTAGIIACVVAYLLTGILKPPPSPSTTSITPLPIS